MGTSTIFRRFNDLHGRLSEMKKEELEQIDNLSPWGKDAGMQSVHGWSVLKELHNGNMHPLIWWYGCLMHLRDAPNELTRKYYSRTSGKTLNMSEWTVLKKFLIAEIESLDGEYKKSRRKKARNMK